MNRTVVRTTLLLPLLLAFQISGATVNSNEEQKWLLEDEENTVDIVNEYGASVVSINVSIQGKRLDPLDEPQEEGGGGSGFIVDAHNRIVTNFHVIGMALRGHTIDVAEGAEITVTFSERPDASYRARVVGAMLDYDLALLELEIPRNAPRGLKPIPIGDSDEVKVGQKVIAIGNPFGLQSTVTTGIISAIDRGGFDVFGVEIPFIQTDAAINPGNSGGPLLNSNGELIGISNAILSPNGAFSGVGLAVPSNLLESTLPELQAGGMSGLIAAVLDPTRPRMGIASELNAGDYPEALRRRLEMPTEGVVVTGVVAGSPADEAGLEAPSVGVSIDGEIYPTVFDVIIAADDVPVESIHDLQRVLLEKEAGDRVRLRVWRNGEERTLDVALRVMDDALRRTP